MPGSPSQSLGILGEPFTLWNPGFHICKMGSTLVPPPQFSGLAPARCSAHTSTSQFPPPKPSCPLPPVALLVFQRVLILASPGEPFSVSMWPAASPSGPAHTHLEACLDQPPLLPFLPAPCRCPAFIRSVLMFPSN